MRNGNTVFIIDRINNRIRMQRIAKRLLRRAPHRVLCTACILSKNGRTSETKQVITLKRPGDFGVHIAELTTMTLIKNHHHMRPIHRVLLVLGDKAGKLLNGGDNDVDVGIFQLPLQYRRGRVGVRRTFLKRLVLTHRLVVQVLTIHHKQHLVDHTQTACQLRHLETRQRLAAARGVPNIATCRHRTQLLLMCGNDNALQMRSAATI